jgi:GDP-D-mannose dehydratase
LFQKEIKLKAILLFSLTLVSLNSFASSSVEIFNALINKNLSFTQKSLNSETNKHSESKGNIIRDKSLIIININSPYRERYTLNNSHIEIYDFDAKRDYLWVGDLVNGILKVIETQKESLNIYNIGSGKSYSAREIVNIFSAHISSFRDYVTNNGQKILIQDCICDNSLFSKDFSWQPKTSMEDGIAKIIKHAELD